MNQDELEGSLELLNKELSDIDVVVDLHIIGGYGLYLHNVDIERKTRDIDSVVEITEANVIAAIHKVGEAVNNPEWFDLGAHSIIRPEGYEKRLVKKDGLSNINIFVLSLRDIICLKVAAYSSRRADGITRDIEDLIKVNPTYEEVCNGLDFLYTDYGEKQNHPKYALDDLKKDIKELKNELTELFKK